MQRTYDPGRELLKLLAIVTMTIDHVGAVLYPECMLFRYVGRLSFPLFAYLIVLGLESTRNVKNYFLRLLAFAPISQVPFTLAFGEPPWQHLNIFFTLASGVCFIYLYEKGNYLLFLPLVASAVLPFDFGIYGILVIGCFYVLRRIKDLGAVLFLSLNLLFLPIWPFQMLATLALPPIILHNDGRIRFRKTGQKAEYPPWRKYSFYIYYPLHLLVLYFVKVGFL